MALEQELDERLKRAIKERDTRTADVVRMIKTGLIERRTAKGFSGVVDDAVILDVIGAYRKQLQKALVEFEKAGERGRLTPPISDSKWSSASTTCRRGWMRRPCAP